MKIFVPVSLMCLAIMMIQTAAHAEKHSEWQVRRLQRRAIVDKLARKAGQQAEDALLKGAHRILDGNKKIHVYQKFGTYSTAVQEFKGVNPISVTKLQGKNKGRIGTVGDRTIFLMKNGIAGRPTIRILQHGSSESERIVYMAD